MTSLVLQSHAQNQGQGQDSSDSEDGDGDSDNSGSSTKNFGETVTKKKKANIEEATQGCVVPR